MFKRQFNSVLFENEEFRIPINDELEFTIKLTDLKDGDVFKNAVLHISTNALTPYTLDSFLKLYGIVSSERAGLEFSALTENFAQSSVSENLDKPKTFSARA